MLKQASIEQVRKNVIPRDNSEIIIAMCYYPRGIKREWRDDYRKELAPDRILFSAWQKFEQKFGHDEAFKLSHYEERFQLSPIALFLLKQYSESPKDIYLVCQCHVGERCHREMLLLTAQKKYGAKIDPIFHGYKTFEERMPKFDDQIKLW